MGGGASIVSEWSSCFARYSINMDDEMIFIGSLLADTPLQRHCDNIKILTP
jgi:hypothetical protein